MSDHGNNLDPVVKTRRVPLPPDQAFTLFSADMGSWWPLVSHSVSGSADAWVSFGVRAGGTVDEHAPDVMLMLGITILWIKFGTFQFTELYLQVGAETAAHGQDQRGQVHEADGVDQLVEGPLHERRLVEDDGRVILGGFTE